MGWCVLPSTLRVRRSELETRAAGGGSLLTRGRWHACMGSIFSLQLCALQVRGGLAALKAPLHAEVCAALLDTDWSATRTAGGADDEAPAGKEERWRHECLRGFDATTQRFVKEALHGGQAFDVMVSLKLVQHHFVRVFGPRMLMRMRGLDHTGEAIEPTAEEWLELEARALRPFAACRSRALIACCDAMRFGSCVQRVSVSFHHTRAHLHRA